MRAVTYDAYAEDNSRLAVSQLPEPKVGPGQVLIEVRAAGVNPVDWKLMSGGLDPMMDAIFPIIPGWDVAGVVTDLGPDTPEFSPGDEVMAYARKHVVHGGTFAEYVAVDADDVAAKPATLDWPQTAGLPLAGMTAQRALDHLDVGSDDILLIYGASGGVGSLGVQQACARGVRVLGTASPHNHDFVRELGGEPVSYGDGVIERVRELAPRGVTAVADFVGGQIDTTLGVLSEERGRHVSIADPGVENHGGTWVWVRPDGAKLAQLATLVEQGALSVEVAASYGFDEVGSAFDASRGGHTRGKLVIVP